MDFSQNACGHVSQDKGEFFCAFFLKKLDFSEQSLLMLSGAEVFEPERTKTQKRLLLTRRGKQGEREREGPHAILGHEKEAVQMRGYRYNLTFAVGDEVQFREGS